MLAVAVRSEWIVRNPADGIEMPQGEVQREVRVLTDDEVERLADEVPPRYRALVLMLTETGARPGEAIALRVKNLNGSVRIAVTLRSGRSNSDMGICTRASCRRRLTVSERKPREVSVRLARAASGPLCHRGLSTNGRRN
jgi:integrase